MSEKGQSRHIFRRQTDGEGSEITLARILDKNFDSTNVFDQFLVQMSRCVGMGEHNHSAAGRHLGLFSQCPTHVSKSMVSCIMASAEMHRLCLESPRGGSRGPSPCLW